MVLASKAKIDPNYPPGPKHHWLMGVVSEYTRNPIGFMSECAKEYGDIVYWQWPLLSFYQLNHPDHIEEVLVKKNNLFSKHLSLQILQRMFGNGLLSSEGDFWQRQRRLTQPAFHRDRIFSYGEVMVDYTNRLLTNWSDGKIIAIHEEMMHLTLEIVAKTLFGAEVTEVETVEKIMQISMAYFDDRNNNFLLFVIPDWVPLPHNLRFQKAAQQFDEIIYPIIQRRRESGEDQGDLLSMLLQMQDENGNRMSDKQLRDEAVTLFIAGHETTALAISWGWYLLSQHPEIEQKLHVELQTVLAGRTPTFADLPQLPYTDRVIMEIMRLYPPAWAMVRTALEDCEIAGYPVRAGDSMIMSQWIMHRDSRYFDQPEVFNPDRWEGDLAKRIPTFAYFPFGGGPRICIGQSFAKMEAVLLLATISQKFRLTLMPDQEITPWPAFSLRPKYGMKMLLNQR
ncbi:cytochrome P450 [Cylindrospermum stagnale PCC 7417]|uniref:Cytochrome P450 n=1 Tax=Cylindrospermum stagnale PCC 7417 TaxID=56107 RepID=K9WW86_9NOST|nr:cytochrome P450 [Cylindrospermum stagnale]AFZ23787.1 cytochrome P450 [Cylindrospermum stagnale PCC 7417]